MPVNQVYVEAGSEIARELYLSLLVDRSRERIAFIASAAGGMDIEEVAATTPEKILTTAVNPAAGLQAYQARQLGYGLGLTNEQVTQFVAMATKLYRLFNECDASLLEINPLIVTAAGDLAGPRRQDQHRRERAVPAAGTADHAGSEPGRRHGAPRRRARPQLRVPRRQHRLHGERRGARHGHHGPHQAPRRRARQLPRRGRRCHAGAGGRGLQADPLQPAGEGRSSSTSSAASSAAT